MIVRLSIVATIKTTKEHKIFSWVLNAADLRWRSAFQNNIRFLPTPLAARSASIAGSDLADRRRKLLESQLEKGLPDGCCAAFARVQDEESAAAKTNTHRLYAERAGRQSLEAQSPHGKRPQGDRFRLPTTTLPLHHLVQWPKK